MSSPLHAGPPQGLFRLPGGEFRLGLFGEVDDLLGPLAEKHSLLGEGDLPAAPEEQLFPQLRLQLHQLLGEGGLGDVKGLGGGGDAFLPGHRQKITHNPQFHGAPPFR